MNSLFNVLEHEHNLIEILPSYQRSSIKKLINQGKTNEEVAEIWLEANGPANTFPFGTENKENIFYEKIKLQIEEFICNEERYSEERKQFIEKYNTGKLAGISFLTASIAPTIGTAPTFIIPVVVLILDTVIKFGVNAWCDIRIEQRKEQNIE